MYGAIRTDDESIDGHYIIQSANETYTLQELKEMEGYIPPITAYVAEIVGDAAFLNPIHNEK